MSNNNKGGNRGGGGSGGKQNYKKDNSSKGQKTQGRDNPTALESNTAGSTTGDQQTEPQQSQQQMEALTVDTSSALEKKISAEVHEAETDSSSKTRLEKLVTSFFQILKDSPPTVEFVKETLKADLTKYQGNYFENLLATVKDKLESIRRFVIQHGIDEPLVVSSASSTEPGEQKQSTEKDDSSAYAPFSRADGKPIADPSNEESSQQLTRSRQYGLRGKVWKALILGPVYISRYSRIAESLANLRTKLDVDTYVESLNEAKLFENLPRTISADEYASYCKECAEYSVTRDDSFRTFRTDPNFCRIVPEQSLVRMCNALINFQNESNSITSISTAKPHNWSWKYTQGLNVFAGVFLYVLPELDAFNVLSTFCAHYIPLYWQLNHIGVQAGCYISDKILQMIDPEIYNHLVKHQIIALIYAFSLVKSMLASIEPLEEAIKLWDFFFAMGPHMSILCVVAQIESLRNELLASEFPKAILDYRHWPKLDAKLLITRAMELVAKLPPDVEEELLTFSKSVIVASTLTKRTEEKTIQSLIE